jgi:ribosomal protein S19
MILLRKINVLQNGRSLYRNIPYLSYYLLKIKYRKRRRNQQFVSNRPIWVFRKSNFYLPVFLNYKFLIHIGRFKRMFIGTKTLIAFKFGEFYMTRRFGRGDIIHQRKKKKKKAKK